MRDQFLFVAVPRSAAEIALIRSIHRIQWLAVLKPLAKLALIRPIREVFDVALLEGVLAMSLACTSCRIPKDLSQLWESKSLE